MKMTENFAAWCKANGKEKLLALYDKNNSTPAEKAAFSSATMRKWHCPVCGMSWTASTNKMNRRLLSHYNVIKKRPEETYCPYCAGARVSPYYSLLTERPWIREFWDEERNGQPVEVLENEKPNTHKKFFFRCKKCGYSFPKPIAPRDIDEALHCPECGDGKSREVTDRNCLAALFPQIAKELADDLNEDITGWNIRPSYQERPLWFRCPDHNHLYQAWVYNRTGRGDGCPLCSRRKKTSFMEQAIFYYIKKCARDVRNNQTDRGSSIDIILHDKQIKVEYNSLYYHKQVRYGQEGIELAEQVSGAVPVCPGLCSDRVGGRGQDAGWGELSVDLPDSGTGIYLQ
jgi:rubrerythrin